MRIKVQFGYERAAEALRSPAVRRSMLDGIRTACVYLMGQVKDAQEMPVDTGNLRASIAYEVSGVDGVPLWGAVGSNVEYAPYMEYGTGTLSDGPNASGARHWPPAAALDVWARRHGFKSGAQVAFVIGRRGGLRPRRFLRNAFERSQPRIAAILDEAFQRGVGEIAREGSS